MRQHETCRNLVGSGNTMGNRGWRSAPSPSAHRFKASHSETQSVPIPALSSGSAADEGCAKGELHLGMCTAFGIIRLTGYDIEIWQERFASASYRFYIKILSNLPCHFRLSRARRNTIFLVELFGSNASKA